MIKQILLVSLLLGLLQNIAQAQTGGEDGGSTKVCLNLEGSYLANEFLRCVPEPRKPCDRPVPCGGSDTSRYTNMLNYHKAPTTRKLAFNCQAWEPLPGCDPGEVGTCPKRCNVWQRPSCHLRCKKCLDNFQVFQSLRRGCLCPNRCCSVAPGEHPNFPGYYRIDDPEMVRCNGSLSCASLPTECRIEGVIVECPPNLEPPVVTEEVCPPPQAVTRPEDRRCTAEIAYELANCSGTPAP